MSAHERLLPLLREARHLLEFERKRRTEPIAIVGMGCRFPAGASSPGALWRLLVEGVDATTEIPVDRWDAEALYDSDPSAPGKCYVKRGAFLDSIAGFDPEFFGISPREAVALDPQQRLLLEVVWEALEDAAIVPNAVRSSATGVWIGLGLDDYARLGFAQGNATPIDAYSALGNARSVAAGRIAYVFDWHGPAMLLDTSCSSSLVALHLACQSLRAGECHLGIVGGVNLMSSPDATVALCKLQALSRDGRCKTFDAAADGYGRGEGCGVVVLKRLTDALAAGDRVHAVVRGTAINHDGRSNGLTAPNGAAQEAVLRAALANAGVNAAAVGYVEAHGTGTLLGDPIELLALNRVYGANRPVEAPLYVGSIKTNLGHLEAAAGMAGLIKTALCVSHRRLVPHLHVHDPNPRIPWGDLAVRVATEGMDWPGETVTALAGVSAFGISGTNAHAVLEQPPFSEARPATAARSAELFVLSARTDSALRAAAARLAVHCRAHPETSLNDLAFSLMTTRSAMDCRTAFAIASRAALDNALTEAQLGFGATRENKPRPSSRPKVAFVFPGQGSQWLGMGRELLTEEPVFRDAMAACDKTIFAEAGWSVLAELKAPPEVSRLEEIDVAQPTLFAMEVALAALWRAWGVEPDAIVGHSMGEVAAACVAGALSLEDGTAIVCRRSALLRRIRGQGQMALVELDMAEATAALAGFEDRLGVAVNNGPRSTVVSGEPKALSELLSTLETRGVFCRRVNVDVASHSPQVDPLLAELAEALEDLQPLAGQVRMHSTVTGAAVAGSSLGPAYWVDNLRRPVRFAQVVEALCADGFGVFIEVSPHSMLLPAIDEIRREAGGAGVAVGSLRRGQPERATLLESLGALYTHGHSLDAERLFPNGGRRLDLPTYPWQRRRYWLQTQPAPADGGAVPSRHAFFGVRVPSAGRDAVYESVLSLNEPPWLDQHRIGGKAVVPAASLAELVRAAAEDQAPEFLCEVTGFVLQSPLVISESTARRVQVVLVDHRIQVFSQPADAGSATEWWLHATAEVRAIPVTAVETLDVEGVRARCNRPMDVEAVYALFANAGLDYGPSFRGLRSLWQGRGEAFAEVELGIGLSPESYGVHPALLEGAFQAAAGLTEGKLIGAMLPVEMARFVVRRRGVTSLRVHARLQKPLAADSILAELTLADPSGEIVAVVSGLHLRRTSDGSFSGRDAKWASALGGEPADRRVEAVTLLVRAEAARVLSFANPSAVPVDKPLKDLGLDSLMALELRSALGRRVAAPLPATLVHQSPTVSAIARHLVDNAAEPNRGGRFSLSGDVTYCETLKAISAPKARLLCFHDAGGSPTMFAPFCQIMGVEVHAISHTRQIKPSATSASLYLDEVTAYIRNLSASRYVLLGHSLGGLFAWRVLRNLIDARLRLPSLLVPSACPLSWATRGRPFDEDVDRMLRFVIGGRSTTDFFKSAFADDVLLWKSMAQAESAKLGVPVAAFVGRDDHVVSEGAMGSWAPSTREFSLTLTPGGHSYVMEEGPRRVLLEELARRIT